VNDVIHPELPGHLARAIDAAIVYHQNLDLVDARKLCGQVGHCLWECLLFVIAGNLNDHLHLEDFPGRVLVAAAAG
jgi:hypothetical protein